jgi:uncharacterized Zn-finger protein
VRIATWKDTLEHTLVIILCDKGFIVSNSSQKHTRRHTGDKPYKCDIYDKEFSTSCTCSLQTHIRTHTGINLINVIYSVCGKEFSMNFSLQRHIRTHTGDNLINVMYVAMYLCSVNKEFLDYIIMYLFNLMFKVYNNVCRFRKFC